jgi:hypothetical protein
MTGNNLPHPCPLSLREGSSPLTPLPSGEGNEGWHSFPLSGTERGTGGEDGERYGMRYLSTYFQGRLNVEKSIR